MVAATYIHFPHIVLLLLSLCVLWLCRPNYTIAPFQNSKRLKIYKWKSLQPPTRTYIFIYSHLWTAKHSMNKNDNVIDKIEWIILSKRHSQQQLKKKIFFCEPFCHHFCRNLCFLVSVIAIKQILTSYF